MGTQSQYNPEAIMWVNMMPHINTTAPPPKTTKINNVHRVIRFKLIRKFCLIMIALHMCQLESINTRGLPVAIYLKIRLMD